MTAPDRIGPPPAAPQAAAAVASALPRRTGADPHAPAAGAPPAPAVRPLPEGSGGAPDPHGISGRLVDVFA